MTVAGFLSRSRPTCTGSRAPRSVAFLVPSISCDPNISDNLATIVRSPSKVHILTPEQTARIAYFPASATSSPDLGMNTDVRFIRPGRPGSALALASFPSIHALSSGGMGMESSSFGHTPFDESTKRTLGALLSAKLRSRRLAVRLGKRLGINLHSRSAHTSSISSEDSEQAWQDEQHRLHVCWRCRRAGGRQKNCRAFRHPGQSLAAEMYA